MCFDRIATKRWFWALLLCAALTASAADLFAPTVTTLAALNDFAAKETRIIVPVRLEASVLWANPRSNRVALYDESGPALVEIDLQQWTLKAGDHVSIRGQCVAEHHRLVIGNAPLAECDGLHPVMERAAVIQLAPGKYPIRVEYFNASASFALKVEMEGGGLSRQPIPSKLLFRSVVDAKADGPRMVSGLNFNYYLGNWTLLPNFSGLNAAASGSVTNITLTPRTRDTNFAFVFTGWIEIPKAAQYTFFLSSDDGAKLWIADTPLSLTVEGGAAAPLPQPIDPGRLTAGHLAWASVEGVVALTQRGVDGRLAMQINANGRRIDVEVDEALTPTPAFQDRVRVQGIAQITGDSVYLFAPSLKEVTLLKSMAGPVTPLATSVLDLRKAASARYSVTIPAKIEATVFASSPAGDALIIGDATGLSTLELGLARTPAKAGERLRIEGPITTTPRGLSAPGAVLIDNDGTHGARERSASIFLRAGKHPIRVGYFNGLGDRVLEVYYEGPGLSRQKIPDTALFHLTNSTSESLSFAPGLEFAVLESFETHTIDFLRSAKEHGIATNFDIGLSPFNQYFAMDFRGLVEVPADGKYIFTIKSDDGSVLALDASAPRVTSIGKTQVPEPMLISPLQAMRETQPESWVSVEGTVSFATVRDGVLRLDLGVSAGHMNVEVLSAEGVTPGLLRGCRVRITGLCENAFASDGQRIAAAMKTPSLRQVTILESPSRLWTDHRVTPIHSIFQRRGGDEIVHVSGRVLGATSARLLRIADQDAEIQIDPTLISEFATNVWIETVGRLRGSGTNVFLTTALARKLSGNEDLDALRLLTTIDEVKSLSRKEAERKYPVRARGVITALMPVGFFFQDATRSIYVSWQTPVDGDMPQVGDYWEVEGTTYIEFAPNISATRAVRLGAGTLPEPVRPTWDQLINASLDTQLIEIEGVVISAELDKVLLLTRSGKLMVTTDGIDQGALKRAENARVRLRGCYAPDRDEATQKIVFGNITLYNTSLSIDEPPPVDPFKAPLKSASDLLRFDTQAGALQRVRVRGEILYEKGDEYFLYDDPTGLRFTARSGKLNVQPGDLVELVGFPELGRISPAVRHATVRKVGHTNLPPPTILVSTNLLRAEHDATVVQAEGQLVSLRFSGPELILEMQNGTRGFLARLSTGDRLSMELPLGATLRLTGVYAGQGGDRSVGRDIDSFELLLSAPSDIVILERPSWWNARHMVLVSGSLGFVLLAAAAWIKSLRRRVEQRTRQLQSEVQVRKEAEEEAVHAREIADTANRAKSQFLAAMSHEIRTPMNGVIGMTNLILETRLDQEQREFAETTRQCAESLLTIINDILDFSKVEAGKLEFESVDFNLVEAIESTIELLAERAHSKELELNLSVHRDVPRFVRGDAARLRQVLLNLVGNGIKFTPEGEVTLEVELIAKDEKRAEIFFSVRDTGIGMDDATRARLFQPFTQADASTTRKYGGTGLGLVISQRLVQLMGNRIEVESDPGKGSKFTFVASFELAQGESSPGRVPAILHEKRALIIEDNATAAEILERHLTELHLNVARSETAREGLALLRTAAGSNEPFDIVIVDGQIADLDALAFARTVRSETALSQTRIILASSVSRRYGTEEMRSAGVQASFNKPVRASDLLAALKKVCEAMPVDVARLESDMQAVAPATPVAPPVAAGGAVKILMAEDNPVNRKVAQRQLKKIGYDADVACNGLEVLEAVRQGRYDVILMDCQMPEMDGYEATRRLRAQGCNSWIIAMTANAMQGDREACLAVGMDDYVTKPVRLNDLEAALKTAAARVASLAR